MTFWINADTPDTIGKDIEQILKATYKEETSTASSERPQKAKAFRKYLKGTANWLLGFDNADNPSMDFTSYMPQTASGHILFTSRNSRLARVLPNAVGISVAGLPDNEALEMFSAIVDRSDITEEMYDNHPVPLSIVKELERFPLAIAQAASFLRVYNSISGADYLNYLRDQSERTRLLSFSVNYENYNETVMTTWEISYQNLKEDTSSADAAKLLCLLGFLEPVGASEKFLHCAHEVRDGHLRPSLLESADYLRDSLNFRLCVDTLVALSLVQRSKEWRTGHRLTLHPLVHEWIQARLLRDEDGRKLRDECLLLSNALALHQIDLGEEWESKSFREQWGLWRAERNEEDDAMRRTEKALADVKTHGIETFLLFNAYLTYQQWIPKLPQKELLTFDEKKVMECRGPDRDKEGVWSAVGDESSVLNAILRETWPPQWADQSSLWSIMEELDTKCVDHELRPYAETVVSGLRCLRALAMEISRSTCTRPAPIVEPTSSSLMASLTWRKELDDALHHITEGSFVAQLFRHWNVSHDSLPSVSAYHRRCSWYAHFRHGHSILLSTINGLLWPQYLRWNLCPAKLDRFNDDPPMLPHDTGLRDLYYALEDPIACKAWQWEARCQDQTPQSATGQARIILPRRFARLYKAARYLEAEKLLTDCLDTFDPFPSSAEMPSTVRRAHLHQKDPWSLIRYLVVIAESMRQREAYKESQRFLIFYAQNLVGDIHWDLEDSICRLALNIFDSGGQSKLEDSEDLLVMSILGIASNCVPEWKEGTHLMMALSEINPVNLSALVLGYIYAACGLHGAAATLLSWRLDYGNGGKISRDVASAKILLGCHKMLRMVNQEMYETLRKELEQPTVYGRPKKGTQRSGYWVVIENNVFEGCQQRTRALERQSGAVKKRFYKCLERCGRKDFHNVDAVWDTMSASRDSLRWT